MKMHVVTLQVLNVLGCALLAHHFDFNTINYMLLLVLCLTWQIHHFAMLLWRRMTIRDEAVRRLLEGEMRDE